MDFTYNLYRKMDRTLVLENRTIEEINFFLRFLPVDQFYITITDLI